MDQLYEHERIPYGKDIRYINPRISFDGVNWWVAVGIEYEENLQIPMNEGIGIDLGIEKLAVTSEVNVYKNINKTKEVKN